jgi:hypothetical protein
MNRMLLAAAMLLTMPALAAPPPPGSAQAEVMAPYVEWVRGLRNPNTGRGCCSLSDCRVVDYRVASDGYEAFMDRESFPGAPNTWLKVPDFVVVHTANPNRLRGRLLGRLAQGTQRLVLLHSLERRVRAIPGPPAM